MSSRRILAALLATTIVSVTTAAGAFEVKRSAVGELVSWRRPNVAWTIDSSVRQVPGGNDAVIGAVGEWTQLAGAPALAVAAVDGDLEPGFDGTNAIFFYDEDGFPPAGGALAVTVLSFDDRTGEVLDADIVLNGEYAMGEIVPLAIRPAAVTDLDDVTYDVGRILAHEMGHALALSDERANKGALMYPFVAPAVALSTTPTPDDIAGLTMLYGGGAASGAEGSSGTKAGCAVVAAPKPGLGYVTIYLAGGLALAALAMARRGRPRGARRGAAGCTMLAAAALVVLPVLPASARSAPEVRHVDSAAAFDAKAFVTHVSTTSVHGVFRSEVEVSPTSCTSVVCPRVGRAFVWGGTIGDVRQVIGGVQVPAAGEQVTLVFEPESEPLAVPGATPAEERRVRTMIRIEP